MKKILIFTTTEGHLSIAQTAAKILRKNKFKVFLVDLLKDKINKPYLIVYRYLPALNQVYYEISKNLNLRKGIKKLIAKSLQKEVKKNVKEINPDLIISNHMFYLPALENFLDYQKKPIPFLNLIPNPQTIHPLEFTQAADYNLVYGRKGLHLGQKGQIPTSQIKSIGWLTREKFYQKYALTSERQKLGFKKNIFTLLICGGSEGSNAILKIIPGLLSIKKPLQVMVVCGTNKTLYKALLTFKNILTKIKKKNLLHLKLFQFTQQLPQLIAVSDLVMGKAGPNLIFEAVALQKPFFACCHIPGQEDGNLDLIRERKIGWVEEEPIKAIKLLQKIIHQPQTLNQFNSSIKKERQTNLQTGKKLVKIVKMLVK